MTEVEQGLKPTRCAICGTDDNDEEVYAASFDAEALNPEIFSARRMPDRIHYRVVRCKGCGLLRSSPTASPELLQHLYRQSSFTYGAETPNLRRTYGRYLRHVLERGGSRGALLEIGCGNGFFLQEALAQGFSSVSGVEPSTEAVELADPSVRPFIVCDVMRAGLFSPQHFDVICMFQVFDHLPDPGAVLDQCLEVLKPGGFLLCVTHNTDALSARAMGERSPIIDIEHTYLYNPSTMGRILASHGFTEVEVGRIYNDCTVQYVAQLAPLPDSVKAATFPLLRATRLGALRLRLPLGNLYGLARRPAPGVAGT